MVARVRGDQLTPETNVAQPEIGVVVSAVIPPGLAERLRKRALVEERSVSSVVRRLLLSSEGEA